MVGGSVRESLKLKNIKFTCYDKFKKIGDIKECLMGDIIFLCLPTPYDDNKKSYNKDSIIETVSFFNSNNYKGLIVLKSTVEPGTTQKLSDDFKNISIVHNPEFLTARTALKDFQNQDHIVIGKTENISESKLQSLIFFFEKYYSKNISIVKSEESELMKLTCNSFYSVKIQFFTEIYLLCQKLNLSYDTIIDLVLKNGWVNEHHTKIPGHDGKVSYGGACFPKDTNSLLSFMKNNTEYFSVLASSIEERNLFRD